MWMGMAEEVVRDGFVSCVERSCLRQHPSSPSPLRRGRRRCPSRSSQRPGGMGPHGRNADSVQRARARPSHFRMTSQSSLHTHGQERRARVRCSFHALFAASFAIRHGVFTAGARDARIFAAMRLTTLVAILGEVIPPRANACLPPEKRTDREQSEANRDPQPPASRARRALSPSG